MKKILFSLAAVAAMVGCSNDEPIVNTNNTNTTEEMTISASIDLSDTRVTIEGEKFTDVKWAEGDNMTLTSVAGASATLTATAAGDTDVRFRGEGTYAADVDTYYAIYPAKDINSGVATFDLTSQTGKAQDAAILAAKTENAPKGVIDMEFKPINALLHVAVSGMPSGAAINKAEFLAYDGSAIAAGFSYNFASDAVTTTGSTTAYTINEPTAAGFFFSLPADLNMANGYIVRLTDKNNNICSKAYNGKTFAKGTTTRVEIAWTQPTVTLGTPMTSYSYYLLPAEQGGGASVANSKANNVIYFPNASSFANIQTAMVAEAGVYVDGVKYAGTISGKNVWPENVTVSSWGEHTVQAYIITKEGKPIMSDSQTVHITGLPYDYSFAGGSLDTYRSAGWTTNGSLRADDNDRGGGSRLVLHSNYVGQTANGYVVSPEFKLPATVNVQPSIVREVYSTTAAITSKKKTGYVGAVSSTTAKNTSSISFSDKFTYGDKVGSGTWLSSFQITPSTPYISISCCTTSTTTSHYFVWEAHFRYAQ